MLLTGIIICHTVNDKGGHLEISHSIREIRENRGMKIEAF